MGALYASIPRQTHSKLFAYYNTVSRGIVLHALPDRNKIMVWNIEGKGAK
jgi:hypothetical protein